MPNLIENIARLRRPADVANWWSTQPPSSWAHPLDDEEKGYLEVFTSDQVPQVMRIGRGIASETALTKEEKEIAKRKFGDDPLALRRYVNWENRRRIVAHYAWTHPATVQYELALYRLSRDVTPLFFVERIQQIFTGKEMFTGDKASRLTAAIELVVPLILGRALAAARPKTAGSVAPVRKLTDPIYDLPPEGGGMTINGRWYTKHALERMAPDTPQIRAELAKRAAESLEKLGIRKGTAAWDKCYEKALKKVDPRGVPPSVVEAEIGRPGSTSVKVITVNKGKVVVSVIPRKTAAK